MRSLVGLRADLERLETQLAAVAPAETSPAIRLMRAGMEAVRDDVRAEVHSMERTRLNVLLDGFPIVGHEIRIDALAKILHSLQEAVSAIGQALAGKATSRSSIPGPLRDQTSLSLAAVFPGSFGATLQGPRVEQVEGALFDTQPENSLLDNSLETILRVIDLAGSNIVDESPIVDEVLPLGSRTFKHLSDLSAAVIDEGMTAELDWTGPTGAHHQVELTQSAARRLGDVLGRNKVTEEQVERIGLLGTVSNIRNRVELATRDGVIAARVIEELVPRLGEFYNEQVWATFDISIARSLATGVETRAYTLVDLRFV